MWCFVLSKIVIVGAGASGIISALVLSKNNDVILLDSNDKCGKKILITGNGKCNYWNNNINIDNYYTNNKDTLSKILTKENINNTYLFLESLGIYPKIKNDMYYPYSLSATSIREIFDKEIKKINFKTNFKVEKIEKIGNIFKIYSNNEIIYADKVVLATGSKAYPKTGSDGSGYILAKNLGHTINKVYPALVPLISNDPIIKKLENMRCDAYLTLLIDNQKILSEKGELQFTKNGLSGICTFNLSSLVSKTINQNKNVQIEINFFKQDNLYEWLNTRNQKLKGKTIEEQLESIFNYKLMFALLEKAGIDKDNKWDNLKETEKRYLCETIENFKIEINGTEDFDRSQVCTGGIPIDEINPQTMESNIVSNLYIIGELLDVDGKCGGFNLAFAFITGFLTGDNNA